MLEWFRHDVECMADDKLAALVLEYGAEGYAVFFRTLETMYHNNGEPLSRLAIKKVASSLKMAPSRVLEILRYAASDECGLLFVETPNGYISDRVLAECEKQSEVVERMRRLGKESARRRGNDTFNGSSTARSTARQQIRQDKNRQDNTESSSYKNVSHLSEIKNDSCKLAESSGHASTPDGVSADGSAVIVTIPTNRNEEFPITEKLVSMWTDTYPAVNVRQELQRMRSWAISNPKLRKTWQGMTRFCDNWLKKEQDRSRPSTPSMFSSGIAADGSDPEKFKNNKTIAELMREQEAKRAAR